MKQFIPLFIILEFFISCSQNSSSGNRIISDSIAKNSVSELWLGTWERRQWSYGATLKITGINKDSIVFSLQAFNGAHGGELEGTAVVKENTALFYSSNENDTCVIEFRLIGDSTITIEHKKGSCYAGMGVTYDGQYKNSKILPEEKDETLLSLGIFQTEKEDSLFRSLVEDKYDAFVYSTQTTSEEEDLDSLHAKVYSSGVTGLYTIQENIIMVDSLNTTIWAAVLYQGKLYYFTNGNSYKTKLPKTIDKWRQRFEEYPVVYK
jgi:hypothetical protein